MNVIGAITCFWFPAGAILLYMGVVIWQGLVTVSNNPIQIVISGGCVLMCGGMIWKQSSFQTQVLNKLNQLQIDMDKRVTGDRMELRLSQERNCSDGKYVTQNDQNHNKSKGTGGHG